jgi:hypothetical protein
VGSRLRYRLGFELHHLREAADGTPMVGTFRRWDCTNSTSPRAISVTLINGIELTRTYCSDQEDVALLIQHNAFLAAQVTAISDAEARAKVKELTGIEHPGWCFRGECGAPIPLGADRCAAGDSIGQVGGGSISRLRWVGTIKPGGTS